MDVDDLSECGGCLEYSGLYRECVERMGMYFTNGVRVNVCEYIGLKMVGVEEREGDFVICPTEIETHIYAYLPIHIRMFDDGAFYVYVYLYSLQSCSGSVAIHTYMYVLLPCWMRFLYQC